MHKKAAPPTAAKRKLTRAEKRQIEAVIKSYKGDGKPHTAQDSIPYETIYPDGICHITGKSYSGCIEFEDINYQLAGTDAQTATFENLCDLYNYVDASIHVQVSLINRKLDPDQFASAFAIPPQGDDLDPIRQESSAILKKQFARGNNGREKTKYLTFTIEADNLKAARARLSRVEADLLGYFKVMGAPARALDGKERLAVLHGVFHPDGEPLIGTGCPRRGFPQRTLSRRRLLSSAQPAHSISGASWAR